MPSKSAMDKIEKAGSDAWSWFRKHVTGDSGGRWGRRPGWGDRGRGRKKRRGGGRKKKTGRGSVRVKGYKRKGKRVKGHRRRKPR